MPAWGLVARVQPRCCQIKPEHASRVLKFLAFSQDRLEVQRLNAARVALERRLSQLDASSDRREGNLSPFTPENDRPWRERLKSQPLKQSIEESNLKTDPTADVSMHWEVEENEDTISEMQQEMVSPLESFEAALY